MTAADGACIGVGGVAVSGTNVTLTLALPGGGAAVKQGQTVTVGYTDPGAGDDTARGAGRRRQRRGDVRRVSR